MQVLLALRPSLFSRTRGGLSKVKGYQWPPANRLEVSSLRLNRVDHTPGAPALLEHEELYQPNFNRCIMTDKQQVSFTSTISYPNVNACVGNSKVLVRWMVWYKAKN